MSQFVFSSYAPKEAVSGVKFVNVHFHSPNGSVFTHQMVRLKRFLMPLQGKQGLVYGKLLMNQN